MSEYFKRRVLERKLEHQHKRLVLIEKVLDRQGFKICRCCGEYGTPSIVSRDLSQPLPNMVYFPGGKFFLHLNCLDYWYYVGYDLAENEKEQNYERDLFFSLLARSSALREKPEFKQIVKESTKEIESHLL